jgi:hypothetical protein
MGPDTIVVFDDYYTRTGPKLEGFGCQALIDVLDRTSYTVTRLEPTESFPNERGVLNVSMVAVTRRAGTRAETHP